MKMNFRKLKKIPQFLKSYTLSKNVAYERFQLESIKMVIGNLYSQ